MVVLGCLLGLRYLYWRGFYTLNTGGMLGTTVSVLLYAAEIYGFLAFLLFYLQVIKPKDRSESAPKESALPTVDILVTIYDESIHILYKTLVGCTAIDYPDALRKIYVLDDGDRDEVKDLAERLGCVYLARKTKEQAKAGNLNHGLSRSSGEFVMILDCDHVPVRTFLKDTLGFFDDSRVAFVQTPHHFYNPDTYQRNLCLERQIVNEQDLFFEVVQPGRDGFNSAFFAGSGGIFRRAPLEKIGGFQVETLTEDLHTSLILHSKGHRSVYLNKILASGLSPESFQSYLKQRQRWARGHMQLFLLDNPLWKRGLTFMQRIHYFASIFYFVHGIPRLIFLSAPLAYLLMGIPPLVADVPTVLFYFLPYYIVAVLAFNLVSGRARNSFWSDVYETASCFSLSWATLETLFFNVKRKRFNVTPKGQRFDRMRLDRASVFPHFILSAFLIVGLGVGAYRLWNGQGNLDATMLSTFWTGYNLLLIGVSVAVARERLQRRAFHRISKKVPCRLSFNGLTLSGNTADISESGLSLILDQSAPLPTSVKVGLGDSDETKAVEGRVVRDDILPTGQPSVGIHFMNVGEGQRQEILRRVYSAPEGWETRGENSGAWRSLALLAMAPARTFKKEKTLRRLSPRVSRRIRCEVVSPEWVFKGMTEDISSSGVSVRLESTAGLADPLSKQVVIQLYTGGPQASTVRGEVVRCSKKNGKGLVCGVRFLPDQGLDRSAWLDASKKVRT